MPKMLWFLLFRYLDSNVLSRGGKGSLSMLVSVGLVFWIMSLKFVTVLMR